MPRSPSRFWIPLANALSRVDQTDFYTRFGIPLTDTNFGDVLDFGDMIRDELVFDDGDTVNDISDG